MPPGHADWQARARWRAVCRGEAVMEGEARTTEPRVTVPAGPCGHGARAPPSPALVSFWRLVVLAPEFTGVISSEFTSFLHLAPCQSSGAACEGPFPAPSRPLELCVCPCGGTSLSCRPQLCGRSGIQTRLRVPVWPVSESFWLF